jgi:predicted dehydrogenase
MENTQKSTINRRTFLRRSALVAGAASLPFPFVGNVLGANDRINVACIGVGGKGDSDSTHAYRVGGNIVGICDVDANTLNGKHKSFKTMAEKDSRTYDGKMYKDWRKMLEELGSSVDAVTISGPDHMHGPAAITAMRMGKHVYCQKPLTQTVWEARELRRLTKEKKLATQMGNQGSAGDGLRRAVEVIQAGVLGAPKELHVWSNRPVWPQGLARPTGQDPVPRRMSITPSTGAAGTISAPALSATWPATQSTCPSARSNLDSRTRSSAKWHRAFTRRPSLSPRASASSFPSGKACLQ